jgi:hypothetical protein
VCIVPVVIFETRSGWPMLQHRLVDTQAGAGLSLRNAGALIGGQLVYLSPLVAVLVVLAAREAWRSGRQVSGFAGAWSKPGGDAVGALLLASFAVPLVVLVPLCLWSRVAEPHWIAPALLSLVPAAARSDEGLPRRLVIASCALAGSIVMAVHAWVLVPGLARLAPATYDARVDIANELQGWPEAVRAVREEALAAFTPGSERGDLVIVGPHWVICAQLEAALGSELPVGCNSPAPDDFDSWWPRARWRRADTILWVTDTRFGPPPPLPAFATQRVREVPIERAGRIVRTFTLTLLTRRARV